MSMEAPFLLDEMPTKEKKNLQFMTYYPGWLLGSHNKSVIFTLSSVILSHSMSY